jgi:hypothetical protein
MIGRPGAWSRHVGPALLQSLVATVRDVAGTPELWRPLVQHDAVERWAVPLFLGETSEVWLQGWPPGERVELHDHGGASGALCVLEGRLVEAFARGLGATRLHRRHLSRGSVSAFGAEYVHDVVNGGWRQALSIQAYSPRMTAMTFYELVPGVGFRVLRIEAPAHREPAETVAQAPR